MKLALAILTLATPLTFAQTAQLPAAPCSTPPATVIDVASIKPSDRPNGSFSAHGRPDGINVGGTVLSIIEYAYRLPDSQVAGGSDWIRTVTWEVTAKVDQPSADWSTLSSEAKSTIQQQRIQAVLAQRFALKCHFETKELPVYNLVLAKGGPKVTSTPADAEHKGSINSHGEGRANRIEAAGVTMDSFSADLSEDLGRTIVNKTGLAGIYDFTLTYTSDADTGSSPSASADADSAPTLFTALEEQLGLKLESARGPVPVLVIDSIDRPSEN